ncbi:hypothetical protein RYX36_003344 [Vicia faba]
MFSKKVVLQCHKHRHHLLLRKHRIIQMQFTNTKASDDELTCSVYLEQVNVGDVLCNLPYLHQFHANGTDPWSRQQGTCPVCKFRAGSGWNDGGHDDITDMV